LHGNALFYLRYHSHNHRNNVLPKSTHWLAHFGLAPFAACWWWLVATNPIKQLRKGRFLGGFYRKNNLHPFRYAFRKPALVV
jgi:hypothetical protein